MGDRGKRVIAFVIGAVLAAFGLAIGAGGVWWTLTQDGIVYLLVSVFGVVFVLAGSTFVYLAVVDTDHWADEGLDSPSVGVGPGWGGDE
ncbi:MAG: hypothetical protein ABEJ57_03035 [Halobacteriaceae archaeon]